MVRRLLPILDWLPKYKKQYITSDITAGITVGIMLIPQGMAYALIAGLPPIYGLYAALVPNLVYVFTGSSRKLAVGPVALDSLIVASSLAAMKLATTQDYIGTAIFLALVVGALQLIMGVMRLGFLSNFLSRPVVSGFTSAAALVIGVSQLKHFFGMDISSNTTVATVKSIIVNFSETNWYDFAIGISAITIILAIKRLHKKLPAAMVVVILAITGVFFFMESKTNIHILGEIPRGLPEFKVPSLDSNLFLDVLPTAIALAFISFAEAMTIAKAVEEKSKEYHTNPNQELRALGFSNIIGSFFQSFPANAGLSRTAVNVEEGAQTGMASLVSVLVVGVTLLFLTPFFYYLPKSVLGAIIMVAIYGLIDFSLPKRLWKQRKDEFYLLALTFFTTLFLGISQGIIFGILFSLLLLVNRTSKPHIAILGRIQGTDYFKNIDRFGTDVEAIPSILILRFDGQLYFANMHYFKSQLYKNIARKGTALKCVILNAEAINYIDSSALDQLAEITQDLKGKGITLQIAGAIGPIRDMFFSSGFVAVLGKEHLFVRTEEAVDYCKNLSKKTAIQERVSQQSTQDSSVT